MANNISELKFDNKNFNKHTQRGMGLLEKSLQQFGAGRSILIDKDNNIIAGNGIVEAAGAVGLDKVKIIETDGTELVAVKRTDVALDSIQGRKMAMADNATAAADLEWDKDTISEYFTKEETDEWGVDIKWDDIGFKDDYGESGSMSDRYGAPPFSVLDTRQGYWQEARERWLSLGIKSEKGRATGLLSTGIVNQLNNGTSIFDPFLCELMYKWFCPERGSIIDPFAGGSVRGVVAGKTGHKYHGLELRSEQVEENKIQRDDILGKDAVVDWTTGDSNVTLDSIDEKFDMIFSCPPYADLEVYSDDPADLSTMEYKDFLEVYRSIIKKAVSKLKDDRFAVFVVSEVRNKSGEYYNFVSDTIKAFLDAGMVYYNEIILVNSAGTLPLRAGRVFNLSRKIGRTHQNILVFYKGNIKNIGSNYGVIIAEENGDETIDKHD